MPNQLITANCHTFLPRERRKREKRRQEKDRNKQKKRNKHRDRREESSSTSSDSSDHTRRRKRKKRRKETDTESSSQGDKRRKNAREATLSISSGSSSTDQRESLSSSESDSTLTPAARKAKKKRRRAEKARRHFEACNEAWDIDSRPDCLKTVKQCYRYKMNVILGMKTECNREAERRNLGEDIFLRDGKPKKKRIKAQTDNGTTKLHEARFFRLPIAHPKEYYKKMPRKHDVVIRNFPMEHYGVQGQVKDDVIGKMHNRTVVLTFDAFGKTTVKTGRNPGGKYADRQQLEEALINYGSLTHALWPMDYTVFAMWRVLCDAKWGAAATNDERKQSELVIEYFNGMLADNCSRAVHSQYPAVFEQVRTN
jgi:hypothetical protein